MGFQGYPVEWEEPLAEPMVSVAATAASSSQTTSSPLPPSPSRSSRTLPSPDQPNSTRRSSIRPRNPVEAEEATTRPPSEAATSLARMAPGCRPSREGRSGSSHTSRGRVYWSLERWSKVARGRSTATWGRFGEVVRAEEGGVLRQRRRPSLRRPTEDRSRKASWRLWCNVLCGGRFFIIPVSPSFYVCYPSLFLSVSPPSLYNRRHVVSSRYHPSSFLVPRFIHSSIVAPL